MLKVSKTGQDTGRLIDLFSSVLERWRTRSCQMCLKWPDYVGYAYTTNPPTCDSGVHFLDIHDSFGVQLSHPTLEM